MKTELQPSRIPRPLKLLAGIFVVVLFTVVVYKPDRPIATIVPGSSSGPTFVVQIIRPRAGLPLGGLLPPQLFGLDAQLGFDSTSADANIGRVGLGHLELSAEDWDLLIILDADGHVAPETQVVFTLIFEESLRKVRCRPGDPGVGRFDASALPDGGEISGSFDIEFASCEDVDTGKLINWPSQPLVLHGSFDRLPLSTNSE
ncbi:MAG: hypothetical protein HQ519_13945 [Planctomycetes bacterium]|nr:hypothetical protein [Planctomycetota bacterium]